MGGGGGEFLFNRVGLLLSAPKSGLWDMSKSARDAYLHVSTYVSFLLADSIVYLSDTFALTRLCKYSLRPCTAKVIPADST